MLVRGVRWTSVRGTGCGNVKFRKWHDRKVQQKEQWRPGDHFKVFPLPKIFLSPTTVPGISKITRISPRDKTESQWLKWSIGQMPLLLLHICAHHCTPLEWLNKNNSTGPIFNETFINRKSWMLLIYDESRDGPLYIISHTAGSLCIILKIFKMFFAVFVLRWFIIQTKSLLYHNFLCPLLWVT